jgi:YggT family protein
MNALIDLIQLIFLLFNLLILARILMSWINPDPYSPIVQTINNLTEPILAPVRKVLPPAGMFDLSPMVVLIGAVIIEGLLISMIRSLF